MRFAIIIAFLTLGFAASAGAAGPYDGSWSGEATGTARAGGTFSGACTGVATATITDNQLKGSIAFGRSTYNMGGRIAADGTFTGQLGSVAFTGKFAGAAFEGSYQGNSNCTNSRVTMKRS